jgi:hypothetical protein
MTERTLCERCKTRAACGARVDSIKGTQELLCAACSAEPPEPKRPQDSQTKLKAIVEKMVEGGLKPKDLFPIYTVVNDVKFSFHDFDIQEEVSKRTTISFIIRCENKGKIWLQVAKDKISLPDLLCNPAAMGALFNAPYFVNVHLYHTLEAVKRIFSESAESAIDYVYKEMNDE